MTAPTQDNRTYQAKVVFYNQEWKQFLQFTSALQGFIATFGPLFWFCGTQLSRFSIIYGRMGQLFQDN